MRQSEHSDSCAQATAALNGPEECPSSWRVYLVRQVRVGQQPVNQPWWLSCWPLGTFLDGCCVGQEKNGPNKYPIKQLQLAPQTLCPSERWRSRIYLQQIYILYPLNLFCGPSIRSSVVVVGGCQSIYVVVAAAVIGCWASAKKRVTHEPHVMKKNYRLGCCCSVISKALWTQIPEPRRICAQHSVVQWNSMQSTCPYLEYCFDRVLCMCTSSRIISAPHWFKGG